MKLIRISYVLVLALLFSCTGNLQKESIRNKYKPYEKFFKETETILKKDNGTFWDHNLYGPVILVDPETREIIANRNNAANSFRKKGKVYVDTLPPEINIANTATTWNNERWTMLMLPLPEDRYNRNTLIIHELFHYNQPEIGFDSLAYGSNSHLDTYEGRLYLRLELEALRTALLEENEVSRMDHILNALYFRSLRQNSEEIKMDENTLEILEGPAEYTGLMLGGRNNAQIREHLIESIDAFYNNSTFVRSFPYQTVPVYGYLLSLSDYNWHKKITKHTNLTDFFKEAYSYKPDPDVTFESVASENDYHFDEIRKEEEQRESDRLDILQDYRKKFLGESAFKLSFRSMNISFDPRNLVPLDDAGTVYPNLRVSDQWGILTVEDGALISSDWSGVIVSEPTMIEAGKVTGKGWTLELNDGWSMEIVDGRYLLIEE